VSSAIEVINKSDENSIIIEATYRLTAFVCVAQVKDEAASGLKHADRRFTKLRKPVNVVRFGPISVALLSQQGEGWARNDKVNALFGQKT